MPIKTALRTKRVCGVGGLRLVRHNGHNVQYVDISDTPETHSGEGLIAHHIRFHVILVGNGTPNGVPQIVDAGGPCIVAWPNHTSSVRLDSHAPRIDGGVSSLDQSTPI